MISLAVRPRSAQLAALIKAFHYHEQTLEPGLERIVPSGQAHLMVNLAEDGFRTYTGARGERAQGHGAAVLAGPHAQAAVLDTREQQWLMAAQFRMGTAGRFFRTPMSAAGDAVVGLEELWGRDGGVLRERLLEAPTPEGKFAVLEEVLLEHLRPEADAAMSFAVAALERGMPVARVAERLGLLPRTLTRRFVQRVGLTPKRFARVRRLQRVLRRVRGPGVVDWSALAAEAGYADQAHLVHDFRDLTGLTPTGYRPQSARRSNHVRIAGD